MTTRKYSAFFLVLLAFLLFGLVGAASAMPMTPFNVVLFNSAGAATDGVVGPFLDNDNGHEIYQLGITPGRWNQMNAALAGGGTVEIHYISGESINIINGDAGRYQAQVETGVNQAGAILSLDLFSTANAQSVPGSYGASIPHVIPITAATFAGLNVGDVLFVEVFSQAQAKTSPGFNFANASFALDNVELVITP